MKREVDINRARIAWNFLQLPYDKRAALLGEFGFPGEEVLAEVLDRLTSEGRLEKFGERVNQAYNRGRGATETGGTSGLFANTYGARIERGEVPAEIVAAEERRNELRKAAEPLYDYLLQYGDPHAFVVVTQRGATLKRDEFGVAFAKGGVSEREEAFEREIREIAGGIGGKP